MTWTRTVPSTKGVTVYRNDGYGDQPPAIVLAIESSYVTLSLDDAASLAEYLLERQHP